MLNSIGLQNPGLEAFVEKQWPLLASLDAQVVVNIAGFSSRGIRADGGEP